MSTFLDAPRAVRPGEELDPERLGAWLVEHLGVPPGAPVTVEQFPSGHSNLTYLVTAGEQSFVLRRPPFGNKVKSAHDMGREYRVLSRLSKVWHKVPEPLAHCDDPGVLGAPFYVMRRLTGVVLRKDPPPGLALRPDTVRALHTALIDGLAELHSIDYQGAGLGELGRPEGYVARQVAGWSKRYRDSQTDDIENIERVARWLEAERPPERDAALIHNDYKLDNVVLDPDDLTRIVGVLDWEMSTVGDPFMDLGTTLSYWVEANDPDEQHQLRWGPTTLPGSLTRADLLARYEERTGRRVEHPVFYYAFGLFKTAVVLQQIYYRYQQGLTQDPRFAPLIFGVGILANTAVRAIDAGRL